MVNRTALGESMEHEPSVRNLQQMCLGRNAKKRTPRSSRGRSETEPKPPPTASTKGKANKKLKKDDREGKARSLRKVKTVMKHR